MAIDLAWMPKDARLRLMVLFFEVDKIVANDVIVDVAGFHESGLDTAE